MTALDVVRSSVAVTDPRRNPGVVAVDDQLEVGLRERFARDGIDEWTTERLEGAAAVLMAIATSQVAFGVPASVTTAALIRFIGSQP